MGTEFPARRHIRNALRGWPPGKAFSPGPLIHCGLGISADGSADKSGDSEIPITAMKTIIIYPAANRYALPY